uniref:RING-type domain-containing protein n=1 Tax=Mesocestoides corti TaxID=53468 RepID=A0A5K3F3S8_MESCO
MTNSQLWSLLYFHLALIGSGYTRYSRFDIAISFSNLTSKFSISVFNLSVANYCIGGLLDVEDGVFGQRRVFEGDLLRLNWHPKQAKNKSDGVNCFHAGVPLFHHSQWIAVIIEDRNAEQACSPFALVNYTVFATDAAAILFLHNFQSPFNLAAKEDDNFRSKALSLRHRLGQLLRRGANSPVFISLPIDMFTDLPNQLAAASESPLIAVTGAIEFFVESPPDRHSGAVASSSPSAPTDLSSSLLLLLIVFVLFLLLAILFVPARLGICFWQRLCFASVAYSAKTKRSRKLTAATKKALKQLPVKHLNQVDPLLSEGFDQCAICIELFKPNDLIRSLPCRHMYHRACIDPWLLKHRSCPLCKQNILISCGMSVAEEDMDSCSATTSELNSAFSFSSASNSRRPSSVFSSASRSMEALFCFSLGNSFGHRRRRTDRRQRHLSSSFEETEPSLGRRVLGSASENSSSSISATGAGPNPSEVVGRTLFATAPGAALSPPLAEKVDDEETRRQSNLLCCCIPVEKRGDGGGGSGGGGGGGGQNIGATPFLFPATPHQSAMVFYQLPQAMAFSPMSVVSKASLPSYEQLKRLAISSVIPEGTLGNS